MNKEELIKEYQKIVLETNGGNDDYVVALCKISNAINELDDQSQKIKWQKLEIQRLNEQVSNLVNVTGHYYREEITILQKALEIACADICSKYFDSERQDEIILHYVNNFKDKAKKELIK